MSVRMAGPARVVMEGLEERRLLAAVGAAVPWDLQTAISAEISQKGEVDYYQFTASAGQKIVFDSEGMKRIAILDSDGSTELDRVFVFDGAFNPTPGRLVWEAPHAGTFYISVAGYQAFLVDVPTGPYSLSAYAEQAADGPAIAAGQTISGSFSSAGDVNSYTFDAKAGTIYQFQITSEQGGNSAMAHYVMGVVEAQPWSPAPMQPQDAQEANPGHNIRFTNLDGQKGLGLFAQWVAPASGTYHFSIAPLDAAHAGAYTVVMTQLGNPCNPQSEATTTSQNTQPTTSSPAGRHRKPAKHHRRPAAPKHAKPAAKGHSNSARQMSLALAKD